MNNGQIDDLDGLLDKASVLANQSVSDRQCRIFFNQKFDRYDCPVVCSLLVSYNNSLERHYLVTIGLCIVADMQRQKNTSSHFTI